MHKEAFLFCQKFSHTLSGYALDLGGRNINGNVRKLWPNMDWTIIDLKPGETDPQLQERYIQANAAHWKPDQSYDLVICTEVFEHTPIWPQICRTAYEALNGFFTPMDAMKAYDINNRIFKHNIFLITCAGPGRRSHSAIDGGKLRENEYYHNLLPFDLSTHLRQCGFRCLTETDPFIADIYAYAVKL